jgi:predicted house-cleaning noncanonical NTP pyrophosphatase (MazG superfamily)
MKLVRDKIIDIIKEDGKTPIYRQVEADEKMLFLAEKIVEEANELKEAIGTFCEKDIIEEMADLLEVIEAAKKEFQISTLTLDKVRQDKAAERGYFVYGYVLEGVQVGL